MQLVSQDKEGEKKDQKFCFVLRIATLRMWSAIGWGRCRHFRAGARARTGVAIRVRARECERRGRSECASEQETREGRGKEECDEHGASRDRNRGARSGREGGGGSGRRGKRCEGNAASGDREGI